MLSFEVALLIFRIHTRVSSMRNNTRLSGLQLYFVGCLHVVQNGTFP
jgi:hypothetical protein